MKQIEFQPITISKDDRKVVLDWQNNGFAGKYSPSLDDPESDSPVLNITFYKKNYTRWFPIPYSQNTTYLLATDPRNILEDGAKIVFESFNKSKEIEWTPQYFLKLSYIHIKNQKATLDMPLDKSDEI